MGGFNISLKHSIVELKTCLEENLPNGSLSVIHATERLKFM